MSDNVRWGFVFFPDSKSPTRSEIDKRVKENVDALLPEGEHLVEGSVRIDYEPDVNTESIALNYWYTYEVEAKTQ